MIDRLRTLSPLLMRYSAYVAAALLMFFVAVGVGATAAVVVGWQFGRVATGPAGTGALEGSNLETTSSAETLETTGMEASGDTTSPNGTAYKASFVHRADQENSRGDYTYVSDPNIDGDANALVLASPVPASESIGAASYDHNIGVWYEPVARKWAIFNQDRAGVPAGAAFEVTVPQASANFVHQASLSNTVGSYPYIDSRLTNGKPDAAVSVTQNWNPGGGGGIYNNHPTDVFYDGDVEQWAIYNRDGAPIPEGAAYNVFVPSGAGQTAK